MRSRNVMRCERCGLPTRPISLCLCDGLATVPARTRVIVVQHRHETFKTSGTARLALAMLPFAELVVRGESASFVDGAPRLLLFPLAGARVLTEADGRAENTLIVPDGSFSQARRIAQRDSIARGAEPVRLPLHGPSRYLLRHHPRDGMLCTIEAIAAALAILDGPEVAAPMLQSFDRFVQRMRWLRGEVPGPHDLLT